MLGERGSGTLPSVSGCSRFAPSPSGEAHPGTLLSGLLCWLDARSRGDRLLLRLEDLDRTRCRPDLAERMMEDLRWFGFDWDEIVSQRLLRQQHERALDRLEALGALYPCRCSRAEVRASGRPAPDGGWAYDNRCRERALPAGGWRACAGMTVRARLPDRRIAAADEGGLDLSGHPAGDAGDPVLVRRDRVIAYHLVVVADDAGAGVTRVVRGRDLAASTATHILLQQMLAVPTPVYRHHLLLLEPRGGKLAKLHGSVSARALRDRYSAEELRGVLAHAAGLRDSPDACSAKELLDEFSWERVRRADAVLDWDGRDLRLTDLASAPHIDRR